jgi:alkylation response protein AidB-like acyl-CoA dehydrogenase
MNLVPTDEQVELAGAAARFLARPDVGAGADTGAGAQWTEMADLGWFGIGLPAEQGGAGGSLADQALLFRELGRGLAGGPALSTTLAARLAAQAGRDPVARSMVDGQVTAGLGEPWRDPSASISGNHVSGRFRVLDLDGADLVLLVAPDGAALVNAQALRRHATVHTLAGPDPSVPVSLAEIAGGSGLTTEATVSGAPAAELVARGRVLAGALLVGILEACRDMSVTYAKSREQFGKPIGSFQAVKHRCADMAVRAECAGSLLFLAALSLQDGAPDAGRLVASAKALASEYAVQSAHDNVQNHGGMGFTAECAAHRYVKRALTWSVTLGSPDVLFAEVAR